MKTINNSIQEDYVDFENAKILKKKGFISYESQSFFGEDGFSRDKKDYNMNTCVFVKSYIERPTIQLAVKWIYENYGIWITVTSISQESWQCHMTKKGESLGKTYLDDFYTPQEAYQAAIKHCLTKIIK